MKVVGMFAAIGVAALALTLNAQDHGHLNVGAESQTPGSKLIFANGAAFATNSGYVKTLTFTNASTYAGYFQGNTTFTALPATADNAGPDPQAPLLGAYIAAQLVSLEGPTGGEFALWETGATTPTYTIKSGEAAGTNSWILSENEGLAGTDPYGHIHGRRWTLTKPGLYKLGLRALDLSTNGVNGGPLHTPSDIIYTFVEAGVNVTMIEPDVDHTQVRFVAPLGTTWQVEAATDITGGWNPIGDPVVGNDLIHEVADETEVAGQRYYRVRSMP